MVRKRVQVPHGFSAVLSGYNKVAKTGWTRIAIPQWVIQKCNLKRGTIFDWHPEVIDGKIKITLSEISYEDAVEEANRRHVA